MDVIGVHHSMRYSKILILLIFFVLQPSVFAQEFEVQKSDAEWRAELPTDSYETLRHGATEAPFSGEHLKEKRKGTYVCKACEEPLFLSDTKFESGCGWPSFYKPVSGKNVLEKKDTSYNTVRTEILCSRCGGHLGHVFNDGPQPTGLRYCINSTALDFIPNWDD